MVERPEPFRLDYYVRVSRDRPGGLTPSAIPLQMGSGYYLVA